MWCRAQEQEQEYCTISETVGFAALSGPLLIENMLLGV
jgi:hypothetical protein